MPKFANHSVALVEGIDLLAREVKDMKAVPPVTKRRIGSSSTTSKAKLNSGHNL